MCSLDETIAPSSTQAGCGHEWPEHCRHSSEAMRCRHGRGIDHNNACSAVLCAGKVRRVSGNAHSTLRPSGMSPSRYGRGSSIESTQGRARAAYIASRIPLRQTLAVCLTCVFVGCMWGGELCVYRKWKNGGRTSAFRVPRRGRPETWPEPAFHSTIVDEGRCIGRGLMRRSGGTGRIRLSPSSAVLNRAYLSDAPRRYCEGPLRSWPPARAQFIRA